MISNILTFMYTFSRIFYKFYTLWMLSWVNVHVVREIFLEFYMYVRYFCMKFIMLWYIFMMFFKNFTWIDDASWIFLHEFIILWWFLWYFLMICMLYYKFRLNLIKFFKVLYDFCFIFRKKNLYFHVLVDYW